ncbi:hypothetical protein CL634_06825, partial [bacterium]|nr:hypothetical protein [bacterium]
MGGLFSSPKTVKAPPPPPIEPPPVVEDTGVEEAERKSLRRRSGRRQTFLTGDLVPETEKKAVLG